MAVYHTLPFVDLSPVDGFKATIREIQERRAGAIAMSKLRGLKQQKTQGPAILNVLNKVVNKQPTTKKFGYLGRIKKVADKFQSKWPEPNMQKTKTLSKASYYGEENPSITITDALDGEMDTEEIPLRRQTSSAISNVSQTFSRGDFKLPSIIE